jgi:hypothetical protein
MSYHYDWLKRQIEIIAAMLAYILAQKKHSIRSVEEAQAVPSGENELYLLLSTLVRQGKLCQAEDYCSRRWKILARWCWMRRCGFTRT